MNKFPDKVHGIFPAGTFGIGLPEQGAQFRFGKKFYDQRFHNGRGNKCKQQDQDSFDNSPDAAAEKRCEHFVHKKTSSLRQY